ncbi:MAG: heavy-metal-associated domain-containing protein [Natronomonas sp.]
MSVESAVEEAIGELSGVPSVSADHEANLVTIEESAPMNDVAAAVEDAGYEISA